jgi:hypothetical protein
MTFTDEGKMMDDYKFKLGLAIAREEELKKKFDALTAYDEDKERELFEAYASTHYRLQELPLEYDDGEYIEPETQYSWELWQACAKSRARSAE